MSVFRPSGIVTLLTDFGTKDTYVGQMKGVLLGIDPTVHIVDLTHGVEPQDIVEGAFHVRSVVGLFPPGTVHMVVVDPGVGTDRKAICVAGEAELFVGPDNGVLTPVLDIATSAFEITNPLVMRPNVTATFHGRDLFAPAAGNLASRRLEAMDLGPELKIGSLHRLPETVEISPDGIVARIVSIDNFGNCITNLNPGQDAEGTRWAMIRSGRFQVAQLHRTFGDAMPGQPLAIIGSSGTLELAVRDGSAATEFGLQRGDEVRIAWREREAPDGR